MENKKTVYIAMSADIIHSGHLNIINEGAKLGDVIIGVLTDEAVATYKRLPLLDFDTRSAILGSIKGVTRTVKQETLSYADNIRALRPDYVVHGDDWASGVQSNIRREVIELLAEYGGKLVEIPYTQGVSTSQLEKSLNSVYNTPDIRRAKLRRMLKIKPWIRVMEASNGLSGLIVENTCIQDPETATVKEYDAMWVSSLCDSTFKGKPDIELVDLTSRINTINEIMEVTSKPIILDGDTGGKPEHFFFNVRTLERLGVSAIIIEDKTGLKQNSLFGTDARQILDDPHEFAAKIHAGKQAQQTRDFMIFARLESLIAGMGIDDAITRAGIYLEEGGADGIMMHNIILNIMLDFGVVGLAYFSCMIGKIISVLNKPQFCVIYSQIRNMIMIAGLATMIHGVTDVPILGVQTALMLIFVVSGCSVERNERVFKRLSNFCEIYEKA